MRDRIFWVVFTIFGLLFIAYLSFPSPRFPAELPGSYQSSLPGDVETPLRRGYYTDMTRSDVLSWYESQFKWGPLLNYPPENAQTLIRDQTQSTFLQEIVHPFRESIYINGFEPTEAQYNQIADGKTWRQKVIVRYVPSSLVLRLVLGFMTLGLVYLLYKECVNI